jgi:hypothetical protein
VKGDKSNATTEGAPLLCIFKNWDVGTVVDTASGIIQKGKYISKDKKFNALIKNAEI